MSGKQSGRGEAFAPSYGCRMLDESDSESLKALYDKGTPDVIYVRKDTEWFRNQMKERAKFENLLDSACSITDRIDAKINHIMEQRNNKNFKDRLIVDGCDDV